MVGLDVENELVLGPLLLEREGILYLLGLDLIAITEDLVESQQGSGHAAAASEEVAPGAALTLGRLLADLGQPRFILLLLVRLGRRHKLLVGGNSRRNRRKEVTLGVKVALTDPHGYSSGSDEKREPVSRHGKWTRTFPRCRCRNNKTMVLNASPIRITRLWDIGSCRNSACRL